MLKLTLLHLAERILKEIICVVREPATMKDAEGAIYCAAALTHDVAFEPVELTVWVWALHTDQGWNTARSFATGAEGIRKNRCTRPGARRTDIANQFRRIFVCILNKRLSNRRVPHARRLEQSRIWCCHKFRVMEAQSFEGLEICVGEFAAVELKSFAQSLAPSVAANFEYSRLARV